MNLKLTRRQLLSLASRTMAFTTVSLAFVPRLFLGAETTAKAGSYSEHELSTLATLSHDLFPHDRLPGSVYQDVAHTLNERVAATPDVFRLIRDGMIGLDRLAGQDGWGALAYEQRVAMLKQVEASPFFTTAAGLVEDILYQHPKVWELVGYGGNALEKGGYLDSLGDITWLPES